MPAMSSSAGEKTGSKKDANGANKFEVAAVVVPEKFSCIIEDENVHDDSTSTKSHGESPDVVAPSQPLATTSSKTAGHATTKAQSSAPAPTSSPPSEPPPQTDSLTTSNATYGLRDVLFGRGVPIQRHMGNIRMHQVVRAYRERYRHASRADKTMLVRETIREIRQGGTRFLKRVEGNDHNVFWREVGEDEVYEKISHALRGNGSNPRMGSPKKRKVTDASKEARTRSRNEDGCPSKRSLASSSTASDVYGTNLVPTGQQLYAVGPRMSCQNLSPASTLSTHSLAAAQLLQNQLRQQLPPQRSTSSFVPGLEILLASSNQQQLLGGIGSTALNLNSIIGSFQQQQQQRSLEDPAKQLLQQLLLSSGNQGALVGQLLHERQQQQARVEFFRQVEQELAMRRLAVATSQWGGELTSQAGQQDQH
jgi:hypothetical protein